MNFIDNDITSKFEKEKIERAKNSLWCERHRPMTLNDYVGNPLFKEKMQSYIDSNDIPHLLLHGKAGTGKTTAAFILTKTLSCDSMYINASNETGVDNVRNKIQGFASSAGFRELKIVILDEFELMSFSAQAALRSLMETFSGSTRFILTCNYVEKVIEPIVSRCQTFNLTPPSRKEVASHVFNILRKENVEASPTDLKFIIDSLYPDIRRIINTLQKNTVNGKLIVNQQQITASDYKLKILEVLSDNRINKVTAFKDIRQILADNSVSDFSDLYMLLYDSIDKYAIGSIAQVIVILAEMQAKDPISVDKEICAMSTIIQILNEVKK